MEVGRLGFVYNLPTNIYLFFFLLSFLRICCGHYFKHLDNVKTCLCDVVRISRIVHVLKAVAYVTSEHLNL